MHWQLLPQHGSQSSELARQLNISQITAQILLNRGIDTKDKAELFLRPTLQHLHDPYLMADMEKAVLRIIKAIKTQEKITVYGDYDADGVTSTAILLRFFKAIGVEAAYYIPNRMNEGYGLHKPSLEKIHATGANLIITVDNGINAVDEAEYAKKLGIDMVITDHHEPSLKLPKAVAVLNPKRKDCKFPFKGLAGIGVVFNLLMALRQRLREEGFFKERAEPNLRELLDIVAVGTVADVSPLLDENRLFVKFGLEELKKTTNKGLAALKIISSLEAHQIDANSIAFRLAPRINAAGRIDDQNLGIELLITDDPERAAEIAGRLQSANTKRQSIEANIIKEALTMINCDPFHNQALSLVLEKKSWHRGVIGIVATKLAEAHKKPAVIFEVDGETSHGSARSIGNYDIISALSACKDLLIRFGGHSHAAGLEISTDKIALFRERFNAIVSAGLKESDRRDVCMVDAEVSADTLTESFVNELDLLEPFGEGNPEPILCMRGKKVSTAQIVGEKHLKLKFSGDLIMLDAIGFGMAHHSVDSNAILDVAFIPEHDTWKGKGAVQLKLRDLKYV